MEHDLLVKLAAVLVLGVGASWLAWRLHLPSILLLLLVGFAAGPVTGLLDPDALLGDLLTPVIAFSVAIILFEGGLTLNLHQLREGRRVVRHLVTVGILVTWSVVGLAAYLLLDMALEMALLLGAILVVTGPTVVGPLLRHLRPKGQTGSVLKFEGILNDAIGALLSVLVFEAILAGGLREGAGIVIEGIVRAFLVGGLVGLAGAAAIIVMLRRHLVPDSLQNPVALTFVVGAFTLSDLAQSESGLIAVTLMGFALANQRFVAVRHILEFKENLRVLLLATLFILLAARVRPEDLDVIGPASIAFLTIVVLVARPLAVAASTRGSKLSWRERAFLAWLAPRGIVAAAVSSFYALRLEGAGVAGAELLVPITFLVIVGTVTVYGLTASTVARHLGIAEPNPQGVVVVGAHHWGRAIARVLAQHDIRVLLVDTNAANVRAARTEGLATYYGSPLTEYATQEIDLDGMGHLLALTPNDEVNALIALRFSEELGRSHVYQVAPAPSQTEGERRPRHMRGRILFAKELTFAELARRHAYGWKVKATRLSDRFDEEDYRSLYGARAVPLFVLDTAGVLRPIALEAPPRPGANDLLIALVAPEAEA